MIISLLVFGSLNLTFAKPFQPYLIQNKDEPVCKLALEHYTKLFNSDAQETTGVIKADNIFLPTYQTETAQGVRGKLKIAKVKVNNSDKLIVYHIRAEHGWRGDNYTGYIIDPSEKNTLIEQIKKIHTPFYPTGSHGQRASYSWNMTYPFSYKDKWYVVDDNGKFTNPSRVVDQVFIDGYKRACVIKIFENYDPKKYAKEFPFFTAYRNALENIMISTGHCGTSHPEVGAADNGRFQSSMAVFRPKAIKPTWWPHEIFIDSVDFQKEHFEDWKYTDVWSYREYQTYITAKSNAIAELANHYVSNYAFQAPEATKLAQSIIDTLPGRYYSLGLYDGMDFSDLQNMIDGTYSNWNQLNYSFSNNSYDFDSLQFGTLSLLIDIPEEYKKLAQHIKPETIKTIYNKDLLMFAAHMNNYDAVKFLVEDSWSLANITQQHRNDCDMPPHSRTNRSALTYAAENASIELIKYLVDAGADTNITDSAGNNLDFYIKNNPRFSKEEKALGFSGLMTKYEKLEPITPSFSCGGKLNRIEEAVCKSEGLSIYDRELTNVYKQCLAQPEIAKQLKQDQRTWVKERNNECGQFKEEPQLNACLARTTRARIRYLEYLSDIYQK